MCTLWKRSTVVSPSSWVRAVPPRSQMGHRGTLSSRLIAVCFLPSLGSPCGVLIGFCLAYLGYLWLLLYMFGRENFLASTSCRLHDPDETPWQRIIEFLRVIHFPNGNRWFLIAFFPNNFISSYYSDCYLRLLKAGCAPCLAGCRWYGICTKWFENLLFEEILMAFSSVLRPETWRTLLFHQKMLSGDQEQRFF